MTLCFLSFPFPLRFLFSLRNIRILLLAAAVGTALPTLAAPDTAPDVLVLSNGDTLHGKFVNAVGGKVTFHSDVLGDISLSWDKIKELHTGQKVAVFAKQRESTGQRRSKGTFPSGRWT